MGRVVSSSLVDSLNTNVRVSTKPGQLQIQCWDCDVCTPIVVLRVLSVVPLRTRPCVGSSLGGRAALGLEPFASNGVVISLRFGAPRLRAFKKCPIFGRCIVRCIRPRWRLSRCSIALQFDIRRGGPFVILPWHRELADARGDLNAGADVVVRLGVTVGRCTVARSLGLACTGAWVKAPTPVSCGQGWGQRVTSSHRRARRYDPPNPGSGAPPSRGIPLCKFCT